MKREQGKEKKVLQLDKLWRTDDWLAVWIGFGIILLANIAVISGKFDISAAKFSTWNSISEIVELFNGNLCIKLFRTFFLIGILLVIGNRLKGCATKKYIIAYLGIFILAVVVRLISAQFIFSRYLEWAFVALVIGLIIANTVKVPKFLKPAIQTEFYIKIGLVIMGFSVLFSNIVNFGFYGLGIAWIVTPIVIIFMWFFGVHVLKMNNKPLVITIAAATSVCGTSAAIATGAAAKAKKTDLSLAVSISIIFTILMMVLEPIIIKATGMGELMGGALIGGTVDSTGAVTVAGTALGELGQTVAVLVKSIQNILIGFIAFAVAIFFAKRVDKTENGKTKVSAIEIWDRLPKFIIGFFGASIIASMIVAPLTSKEVVNSINSVLDQYKNWLFVMAFICIGLDTNFKEIKEQFQGGKPMVLYIVGQLFNIILTFIVVYILLSGRYFPLPKIGL